MNNQELEKFLDVCRVHIGNKTSVSDEEIIKTIDGFSPFYPTIDKEIVKKKLLEIYTIPIVPYKTILNSINPGAGWLSANKRIIEPRFWSRYSRYLVTEEKYQPGVIHQLDNLTNEILDNLFDPTITDTKFEKKGLVVGQVQSGKTSNFTGLICKAVDSGFNVIIVFAGMLDDLRTQTQSRLENCFLGFTTKNIQSFSDKENIGVGTIDPHPIAHAFTTVLSDFKETTVNSLGANFQTKEPIIFIVKKNGRILNNLRKWLSKKDLDSKTALFIDDEADSASINTSAEKEKASSINEKIRAIIKLFKRNAYVGYTATPYANIFIDRKDDDDLFPKHFIVNLPTPPAYLSPERVFGLDKSEEQPLPIVNIIDDYLPFVPDKHKKNDTDSLSYENFPESLKYAIRCFIISCAVRIVRGQEKKHNSMLIHISRYQIWQNRIKELVKKCFDYYKQEILADDQSIINTFQEDYEKNRVIGEHEYKSFVQTSQEIVNCEYNLIKNGVKVETWDEVKTKLYDVVSKIEVKALNGASQDVLAYDEHKDDGYYVIAIGGDKLSRGLTLEGLTISYFLRASKMYDTLMQMGRWFGYRPGYVDVCRLFVSNEIYHWFRHITIANNELRSEFDYLWEIKGSPQQYAMKVRTSPGLLVTSPMKMRTTQNVQLSWASTLVETYSLIRTDESRKKNFKITSEFLVSLGQRYTLPDGKDDPRGFLWENVDSKKVCKYIRDFEIASTTRIKLDFEKMVQYINSCVSKYGELSSWRVLLRNNSIVERESDESEDKSLYFLSENSPRGYCTNRTIVNSADQDYKTYNLKNYHLISGPNDEFLDMYILGEDKIYFKGALEETIRIRHQKHIENPLVKEWNKDYPDPKIVRQSYRPKDKPLLIIYPLNPVKANVNKDNVENYLLNSLPFIGFAIVFPSSENTIGFSYKVNDVPDFAETEVTFEQENDNPPTDE